VRAVTHREMSLNQLAAGRLSCKSVELTHKRSTIRLFVVVFLLSVFFAFRPGFLGLGLLPGSSVVWFEEDRPVLLTPTRLHRLRSMQRAWVPWNDLSHVPFDAPNPWHHT
jgi:hypothetical protein